MIRLEQYRKERAMSIRQLSIMTGVSRTYLTGIEEGVYDNPGLNAICSICKAFQITPNDLIPEEMYR